MLRDKRIQDSIFIVELEVEIHIQGMAVEHLEVVLQAPERGRTGKETEDIVLGDNLADMHVEDTLLLLADNFEGFVGKMVGEGVQSTQRGLGYLVGMKGLNKEAE